MLASELSQYTKFLASVSMIIREKVPPCNRSDPKFRPTLSFKDTFFFSIYSS